MTHDSRRVIDNALDLRSHTSRDRGHFPCKQVVTAVQIVVGARLRRHRVA